MTQAHDISTRCLTFQLKLMDALEATWAMLEGATDPAVIRQARDTAKAIGDLAAQARKVALAVPTPRGKPRLAETVAAGLHAAHGMADLSALMAETPAPPAPVAAQAEHARRALEKLKGGRRGRL
ncbi:hypothetical protein [Caulobacter sp. UNC358MFTsu5.1]|uniref:hypothetical protein n=1 Tax=Caulobacter sp. UNC358MFTsu5.1 TaxID=1449049 RepID=UPI0004A6DC2D|nr:hypothetical protein [Caulobacter sp. UNC358MFTsu5.1]